MEPMEVDTNTPSKMTTRGGQRVNYNELNRSGGSGDAGSTSNDDAVFRSPKSTTRGIKRRNDNDGISTPAARGVRSRGRATPASARGGGRGSARRPLTSTEAASLSELDESGLFGAVKSGKNMNGHIDDWIEDYEKFPEGALLKLQQFLLHCCGCRGVLKSSMIQSMEYSEIVRRMTEDFDEDSGDYPLVMSGPHWKKFRNNLHVMLQHLIDKCKDSIIYDDRMMDSVIQLLTSLADSQVRAFRHTATFAAVKVSSSLVDVIIDILAKKDKNAKQIEAEKAKLKNNVATNDKLDMLIQKKNEYEERAEEVRQQLSYIFKSVFVHRYRDVIPDTRSICITELGNWMAVYPEHFLDDSYLKYIGWSLHDKVPDVRLKCVNALLPLYDKQDTWPKLELFTNKFKDRLVSMVLDRDNEVAMISCKLMTNIYRVFPTLLSTEDCIPIYELVYANHRGLAVAAGEFLNVKVFQHFARSRAGSLASNAGRAANENARLIRDLTQFYIEGEVHNHATYLVDALIDTNPIMKDWQAMVDLLLGDEIDAMESQLIEILACAVKQAATAEVPIGRGQTKRGAPTTKESRQLSDDRVRMSEVLIPAFPLIMQKFIADREKVANLITIPLYFQLDMYLAGRLENHLLDLMRALDMIVEKHTDEEILCTVAEIITYFTSNTAVAQHTETARLKMIDGLALQLRNRIHMYVSEEQSDEEDEAALLAAMKKVACFVEHIDMKKWDLWETILQMVVQRDENGVPQTICDLALEFLLLQLGWDLNRIVKDQETNKNDAVRKLKKKRDQLVHMLDGIVSEAAAGVELSFLILVDCLIMFNDNLATDNPALEPLVLSVDNDFVNRMKFFVGDNVFSNAGNDTSMDQQQKIDLMHKKRKILTQYCKMITHGVFKIVDAAAVLSKYGDYYTEFGDILKQLLVRIRDLDFFQCAKAVVKALCDAYEYIRMTTGIENVDPLCEQFNSLRDLAKRFASSFGNDHVKNREAVAFVHRDGIQFALQGYDPQSTSKKNKPANLSFLEIIMEFSPKLLKQDKQAVLKYLERHGGTAMNMKEKFWEPCMLYRGSLTERHADDASSLRSFSVASSTPRGGGRGRGGARGRSARIGTPSFSEAD